MNDKNADEPISRMEVWLLDETSQMYNISISDLLLDVLKPEFFERMSIIVCLDAERITKIEGNIKEWMEFIMKLTEKYYPLLGLDKVEKMKAKSMRMTKWCNPLSL
jgi:hypothetical protein